MKRISLSAGAVAAALALSGCGLLPHDGGNGTGAAPKHTSAATAGPGSLLGGHHYRKGWFEVDNNGVAYDVHRIERYPAYSVVYLDLYTVANHGTYMFGGGSWGSGSDFGGFALVDPVNGKQYSPLRQGGADGPAFGSRVSGDQDSDENVFWRPGVRHALMMYFPPLPATVKTATLLTPATTGEFTGIPVYDGGRPRPTLPRPSTGRPKAGQTFFWKVYPPAGRIWSRVRDLHDYVEAPRKLTSTDGDEQKIGLRTDVLFAFDKANLSPKAHGVLDDAINETRAKADPAKPPVTITGYTDAKGSDAYNLRLSQRRAAAVERYIASRLGSAYRYETQGRGESDPVAPNTKDDGSDNPAGRAKNRRVEIGYTIKQRTTTTKTTGTDRPTAAPGANAGAARFRGQDGPAVGTVRIPETGGATIVTAHPFYRDGRYLVAPLDFRASGGMGSGFGESLQWSDETGLTAMRGATFGGVSLVDPASKTRYYEVRVGAAGDDADFLNGDFQTSLSNKKDTRVYVYYSAPPPGVAHLDLRLGSFGTVHDVPIR